MAAIKITPTHDFKLIQKIAYETWPTTYGNILSKEQLDYMLELIYSVNALEKSSEKGQIFLVAEADDIAVGFISYEHHYEGNPVTRIHKIYLLPETQGKGIGKMLIEKVNNLALSAEDTSLSLNVNRNNSAQMFYKNLGFTTVAEENIDIGNGYFMEDFVMKKELNQQQ